MKQLSPKNIEVINSEENRRLLSTQFEKEKIEKLLKQ